MRIAVLTFGSRGDVQPFVALTRGLVQAGHDAFLCAPSNFAAVAAEYDVPFRAQPFDSRELSERPEVKLAMEGGNPLRILLLKGRSYILDVVNWDAWLATRDVDAMVFKVGMPSAAYCISRKRRIPGIEVSYMPLEPSAEFPSFAWSLGSGNRMLNRLTGEISYRIFWGLHNPSANLLRSVYLDLPKLSRTDRRPEYRRVGQPTLYVFSPSILPRPADWREEACVVGYQYLNEPRDWSPPDELCRFLAAGPKPLFVGFGSMQSMNPREKARIVLEAVRRSGQRAVWQGGWAGADEDMPLPEGVFSIGNVPYSWLLPRMSAVVHCGGAGTSSEVFRAGVPGVVVPHNFDQPFWARRAFELGLACEPIPYRRLSSERLADAIHRVATDEPMRRRAAEMGERIGREDGVGRAVEFIENYARTYKFVP